MQSSVITPNEPCEKELTLFELSSNFSRHFETGRSIDPFLEVTFAKQTLSTEVHKNGGKQPQWKTPLKFNFLFQSQLSFSVYDEQADRLQQIGAATVGVNDLKGGKATIKLMSKGSPIGQLSFKYELKKLPGKRNMQLQNVRLELFESLYQSDAVQCCFIATVDGKVFSTSSSIVRDTVAVWEDYLRLRLPEQLRELTLSLQFNGKVVGEQRCLLEEYEFADGSKQHYFTDFDTLEPFAMLSYNYRSVNVSQPPLNSFIKSQVVDKLTISDIKVGKMPFNSPSKLCLRALLGRNYVDTGKPVASKLPIESYSFANSLVFYKEARQKKLQLLFFETKLTRNKLIGRCDILLKELKAGTHAFKMASGIAPNLEVCFSCSRQPVNVSSLVVSDIELKMPVRNNQLHLYVRVSIGSVSTRTETAELGKKPTFLFKKQLSLLFSDDQELQVKVYDQDISTFQLVGSGTIRIDELRGDLSQNPPSVELRDGRGCQIGVVTFQHTLKLSNTYLKMLLEETGVLQPPQPTPTAAPGQQKSPQKKTLGKGNNDRPAQEPARGKSLKFSKLPLKS